MTVAVIGIALALPAGLHLVVANGRTLSGHWEGAAELSVFMRADVPLAQVEGHAKSLRSDPAIGEVTLIPPTHRSRAKPVAHSVCTMHTSGSR